MNLITQRLKSSCMALLTLTLAILGAATGLPSHATEPAAELNRAISTSADPMSTKFSLAISNSADRGGAIVLNGTGTRFDGEVAVFLDTEVSPQSIRSVTFYVNGRFFNREYFFPYDLGSTRRSGNARLVETAHAFDVGPNKIAAVVRPRSGSHIVVEATLNVLPKEPSIVEIASGNGDFSVLVEALVAADLVDAVSGPGPFTVFAPTDAAFVQLLGDLGLTKEELLANKDLLTTVLTYHVLPNALFAEAVLANDPLIPLQGEPIAVNAAELKVNDSNLIAVDIAASNGVIHVIDAVLLPPSIADPLPTIAEIATGLDDFSILVEAVVETGLVGLLSVDGPNVTVFAPTNDAFVALLDALGVTKQQLFDNKPLLTTVLLYHLVNEELFASDVLAATEIFPMESEPIVVDAEAAQLNGINIVATDIDASNGVIHVIDGVLIPPAALALLGE